MNYYDNFESFEYETYKIVSGWLDTSGNLYKCSWGKHTSEAYDLIRELDYEEEYEEDERASCMENARDWLVRKKNWVLLDNPSYDKKTQVIVYNPLKKHTKAQLDTLFELFKDSVGITNYIMENIK